VRFFDRAERFRWATERSYNQSTLERQLFFLKKFWHQQPADLANLLRPEK